MTDAEDNLFSRIKARRIAAREDTLLKGVFINPSIVEQNEVVSEKNNIRSEIQKLESELSDIPPLTQRPKVHLQKDIATELAIFAKTEGVTVETVIEAMWLSINEEQELKDKVADRAKKQYKKRVEIGNKRKKLTRLRKKLQNIH